MKIFNNLLKTQKKSLFIIDDYFLKKFIFNIKKNY